MIFFSIFFYTNVLLPRAAILQIYFFKSMKFYIWYILIMIICLLSSKNISSWPIYIWSPLFSSPDILADIIRHCHVVTKNRDDVVIRQGDVGDWWVEKKFDLIYSRREETIQLFEVLELFLGHCDKKKNQNPHIWSRYQPFF